MHHRSQSTVLDLFPVKDIDAFQPYPMTIGELVDEFEYLDTSTCFIIPSSSTNMSMP